MSLMNSLRRVADFTKKLWRKTTSPSIILWILILALVTAVTIASYVWTLEPAQILSASIAAAAVPLAFITQRAILRENQKQTLRQQAYSDTRDQWTLVKDALISMSISNLDSQRQIIERAVSIREATASLTYTYHAHEMVFKKIDRYFKFFHFSLDKLARTLDQIAALGTFDGYGDLHYNDKAEALLLLNSAKEQAEDLKSYLYDLQKELIEELGFSKLFGIVVERRRPKLKKYKTLREAATKKAVRKLEEDLTADDSSNDNTEKQK